MTLNAASSRGWKRLYQFQRECVTDCGSASARLFPPAKIIIVDTDDNSRLVARKPGATEVLKNSDGPSADKEKALTDRRGVDVAMEAVGVPARVETWQAV